MFNNDADKIMAVDPSCRIRLANSCRQRVKVNFAKRVTWKCKYVTNGINNKDLFLLPSSSYVHVLSERFLIQLKIFVVSDRSWFKMQMVALIFVLSASFRTKLHRYGARGICNREIGWPRVCLCTCDERVGWRLD